MKPVQRQNDVRELVIVGAIVLAAFLIRGWGLNFDLPYLTHPDEPNKIEMAQRMFKTGDLNPHYFWKPTLFIYLNAALYGPYYAYGPSIGPLSNPSSITPPIMLTGGNGWTPMPNTVLMGRSLTLLSAILSIPMIYLIGRRVYNRKSVGYLAAVLLALSPNHVYNSRFITVNAFLVLAILVVTWFSVMIYDRGKTRDYVFAGLATGSAVSLKYPGIVVASSFVAAHLLRIGWKVLWTGGCTCRSYAFQQDSWWERHSHYLTTASSWKMYCTSFVTTQPGMREWRGTRHVVCSVRLANGERVSGTCHS